MRLIHHQLIEAARELAAKARRLKFAPPVTHVYHPLSYAWAAHELYLSRYGRGRKRVIFLGMNPGPYGMVQTGVPFGEVAAVRGWMGIEAPILRPVRQHPKRLIEGFACPRSEVSGRRLWGLFAQRWPRAEEFFADHFVVNYCPLAFVEASGANYTPDKLRATEKEKLLSVCDEHLRRVGAILRPDWLIGIGQFAEACARRVFPGDELRIGTVLHPSPASPAANRDWAGAVTTKLKALGIWS